jgi:hypothetical protein
LRLVHEFLEKLADIFVRHLEYWLQVLRNFDGVYHDAP